MNRGKRFPIKGKKIMISVVLAVIAVIAGAIAQAVRVNRNLTA